MRVPVAASVLALAWAIVGAAGLAHAAPGTISLSWNGCASPVVSDLTTTAGQAGGVYLVAYLEGQSDSTAAYELLILYGNAQRTVPDAWRFDPNGCQSEARIRFDHRAPVDLAPTCPSFENAGLDTTVEPALITVLEPDPPYDHHAGTLLRIAFAENSFPRGNAPDPSARYFLLGLAFDHSLSSVGPSPADRSTCGGIEEPMCFNLDHASYITSASEVELPFVIGPNSWLTTNGFGASCVNAQLTPARAVTWGRLKSQYRN